MDYAVSMLNTVHVTKKDVKEPHKCKVIDGITIEVATINEIPGSIWVLVRESGQPTWSTSFNFGDSHITNISIKKITSDFGEADAWIYVKMENGENWRCKLEPKITHIECLRKYLTYSL